MELSTAGSTLGAGSSALKVEEPPISHHMKDAGGRREVNISGINALACRGSDRKGPRRAGAVAGNQQRCIEGVVGGDRAPTVSTAAAAALCPSVLSF